MALGKAIRRPLYAGVGLVAAAALAFSTISMCVRGAPVVVPPDYGVPPAVTAPAPSPSSGLEGVVTATPAPATTPPICW